MNYCIKKILLLTLFSLLLFQNKLFAIESVVLPHEFTSEGFKLYNSLPEVELADKKLQKSNSFEKFLREAQDLAQRYNLEDSMGVRLIHRHTDIDNNQIMIEKRENFKGQDALVTRPYSKIHENDATPASWIFDGERYRVFEYSYDAYVAKIFEKVRNSSEFLREFALLLERYNYPGVALAITDREWYQNCIDKHSFLERSYIEPTFASVVVNTDELEDTNFINTSWSFKKDPVTLACATAIRCVWNSKRECHDVLGIHEPFPD